MPVPLAAIAAIAKTGYGIHQTIKGKKMMEDANRPTYEMPQSEQDALDLLIQELGREDGIESRALDQSNLAASNAIQAASEGGNVMETISAIQANQQATILNSLARGEQERARRVGALIGQQNRISQYKDREFEYNKMSPYLDKFQEGRDIYGAGVKNAWGGFSEAANIGDYMMGATQFSQQTPNPNLNANNPNTNVMPRSSNFQEAILRIQNLGRMKIFKGDASPQDIPDGSIFEGIYG